MQVLHTLSVSRDRLRRRQLVGNATPQVGLLVGAWARGAVVDSFPHGPLGVSDGRTLLVQLWRLPQRALSICAVERGEASAEAREGP